MQFKRTGGIEFMPKMNGFQLSVVWDQVVFRLVLSAKVYLPERVYRIKLYPVITGT